MFRWPEYPRLYFNQAGSGPAAPAVRARVREVDEELARLGGHAPDGLALAEQTLAGARLAVGRHLGLPAEWQISFCTSATDAPNLVASAVVPRVRSSCWLRSPTGSFFPNICLLHPEMLMRLSA